MKVSVLVPVYNGERYLAECLDSVLAQRFDDMEILVSDDASSDDSLSLIQQFAAKDSRIRWWQNAHRLGAGGNLNHCLRAAQGEYVKFVLQDDKLTSPDAIRLMAEKLDEDPSLVLVGSASSLLDEKSQVTGCRSHFQAWTVPGIEIIRRCLEQPGNLIGEPSVVMFRRSVSQRGFDERFRQLLDYEMWIHLLSHGRFAYLTEPLCAFRRHALQATVTNRHGIPPGHEELLLLTACYQQPWFREVITPRLLFAHVYWHRRACATGILTEMRRELGTTGYYSCWVAHKAMKLFNGLRRITG